MTAATLKLASTTERSQLAVEVRGLSKSFGRTKALEYLILGTQIPASECLALGLVNRLCKEGETLNNARALANQLAKRPPIAIIAVMY